MLIKPLRKERIVPVLLITAAVAFFSFFCYSYVYIAPTEEIKGRDAQVTAVLCDIPYEQNGRYYYKLETSEISIANTLQNTTILVSSKTAYDIDLYDEITAEIRFFDDADGISNDYYISKKVMLRGTIDNYSEVIISEKEEKPLYYYALLLRQKVMNTIDELLPENEASFIKALILGDKTGISYQDRETFISSGISHIISVSGLHLSVITQFFMMFLCFVTRRKRLSSLLCTFFIFIFMAEVGFSPSVFRAGIMQIIFLIGQGIIRRADSLSSLGASSILICFLNPYAAADVGFLLSFCATLGIILCNEKMNIYITEHI